MAAERSLGFAALMASAILATPSGPLAQSVEQRIFNPLVDSSNLSRPTSKTLISWTKQEAPPGETRNRLVPAAGRGDLSLA